MTGVLRAFVSIDSDEQPGTYRAVTFRIGTDSEAGDVRERVASGAFLLDWQNAMIRISERAVELGCDVVILSCSSSVDMWEANSCEFESFYNEEWLWWRRVTAERAALLRGDLFMAMHADDLRPYAFTTGESTQ